MRKGKILLSLAICLSAFMGANSVYAEQINNSDNGAGYISPLVNYEFNDSVNPGLDSCGNFDLKMFTSGQGATWQIMQEDDQSFIRFTRNNLTRGSCLYAPVISGTNNDFSDLVEGSFSVGITFRRDNQANVGDHYVLALGQYNDALQITPHSGKIQLQLQNVTFAPGDSKEEKQKYMESATVSVECDTTEWTSVFITEDVKTNKANVYVNGELALGDIELNGVSLSTKTDKYAFALGGQCTMNGTDGWMFADVDIKNCSVYNSALTAENVKQIYNGDKPTYASDVPVINSIDGLDESFDSLVTNENTVEDIKKRLPKFTIAQLLDGTEIPVRLNWYNSGDELKGYILSDCLNPRMLFANCQIKYGVKFTYDSELVEIIDVKIDDNPYDGYPLDGLFHTLSFKVNKKHNYAVINGVNYSDMKLQMIDGEYRLSFTGGIDIVVNSVLPQINIVFYDANEVIASGSYTYGDTQALLVPDKQGYIFEGWYTDENCTVAHSWGEYNGESEINLYAKFVKEQGDDSNSGGVKPKPTKRGCRSSISWEIVTILGIACFILKRK